MANKIFYWLKFKNDFFSSLRIKKLRKDYGDTCLVIYLKLQLFALETDGVLEYKGVFPTFAEEMAEEIGEDPEKVKDTIDYLISCGLMDQNENTYILPFVKENTGAETDSASKMRDLRERRKASQCSNNVTEELCDKNNIHNEIVTDESQCYNNVTGVLQDESEIITNESQCYNNVTTEIRDKNIYNKISSKEDIRSSQISKNIKIVVGMWNQLSSLGVNPVTKIASGTERHRNLCARLKQYSLDDFEKAIENIKHSDFLLGNVNDFKIKFDWFVKPSNFIKVLDGNYSNTNNKSSSGLSDRWKGDS